MKPRIAIFHSSIFESANLSKLRAQFASVGEITYFPFLAESPAHLKEHARSAEMIIMNDVSLSFEDLADFPDLKMISLLGSGYDMIDLEGMQKGGVTVCNAPTYGIENVAQHAVALILELAHRVGTQNQRIAERGWDAVRPDCISRFPILELKGKTLGLVGFGNIANRLKEMLAGFQVRCIAYSSRSEEELAALGVAKVSLDQVFAQSDFLSIHARSTEQNRQMVNQHLLQLMKPTSFLINTARGALIHEQDLAAALRAGTLAGAALDVLDQEPPSADCPLLGLTNCIHTPHIAWNSHSARERITHESLENIRHFLRGEVINQVN